MAVNKTSSVRLPELLKPLFWEYDFGSLSVERDKDFLIRRILTRGDWSAIAWLRRRIGDKLLRKWILEHEGRGLSPQQLRFWQVMLKIPKPMVDTWIRTYEDSIWRKRLHH
jgi:hypothetical protein